MDSEAKPNILTTDSFIAEAKKLYGDTYSYGKTIYKSKSYKVVVTCPIHGDFEVLAHEHLAGKRCPKCTKGEKFLNKLHEKFGDRFGLEEFCYTNSTTPVKLICPQHGLFEKLPGAILSTTFGCPMCAVDFNNKEHEEAVAREEAKKAKKREETERQYQERCDEVRTIISKIKEGLKKSLAGDSSNFIGIPFFFYRNLIDEYINIIRYNSRWIESLRQEHLLSQEEAELQPEYEEGFEFYFYPGDAPDPQVIEYYQEHRFSEEVSLEQVLSHRLCEVKFRGNDLYIIYNNQPWEGPEAITEVVPCKSTCQPKKIPSLPKSFIGIDFETLYSQRVSACSVGMVKYRDGKLVDRYYSLIRPPFDYPGKSGIALTWIHGFTEEMLRNERTFEEVLPEMEAFAEGLPLVAHNASVEKACIRDTAEYYGLETSLDYENIWDTLTLSRRVEAQIGQEVSGPQTHTLDAVCRRFGVPEMNHHNALDDAEMCGNLLVKFEEIINSKVGNDIQIPAEQTQKSKHEKYNAEDKVQRTDLENVAENPFKGCSVVLTGFSTDDSQKYGHQLKELGAKVCTGVSGKTQWLICGSSPGPSKMKKAQDIGAKIISEEEFLAMIKNVEQ